jgi:predicted nucleic acid-binding Zn ribbon protein
MYGQVNKMSKRDLAKDLFISYKTGYIKKPRGKNNDSGREVNLNPTDPQLISDVLKNLIQDREWQSGIAEGNLFANWESIVGAEIAEHTEPIAILEGVLTIRTSSTAWATQLNLISNDVLASLQASAPGALVEKLSIIGPQGPSWKRGIRTIRGARGPRDTFG